MNEQDLYALFAEELYPRKYRPSRAECVDALAEGRTPPEINSTTLLSDLNTLRGMTAGLYGRPPAIYTYYAAALVTIDERVSAGWKAQCSFREGSLEAILSSGYDLGTADGMCNWSRSALQIGRVLSDSQSRGKLVRRDIVLLRHLWNTLALRGLVGSTTAQRYVTRDANGNPRPLEL